MREQLMKPLVSREGDLQNLIHRQPIEQLFHLIQAVPRIRVVIVRETNPVLAVGDRGIDEALKISPMFDINVIFGKPDAYPLCPHLLGYHTYGGSILTFIAEEDLSHQFTPWLFGEYSDGIT